MSARLREIRALSRIWIKYSRFVVTPSAPVWRNAYIELAERRLAIHAIADDFGEQRIVMNPDLHAILEAVSTRTFSGARQRCTVPVDGRKAVHRILGISRASIAWPMERGFCGKRLPSATSICNRTRSSPVTSSVTGMLHLNARVHLDEIELADGASRNSTVPALV